MAKCRAERLLNLTEDKFGVARTFIDSLLNDYNFRDLKSFNSSFAICERVKSVKVTFDFYKKQKIKNEKDFIKNYFVKFYSEVNKLLFLIVV